MSKLEDIMETIQNETQRDKKIKKKRVENISDTWESFEQPNIQVFGVPKADERQEIFFLNT